MKRIFSLFVIVLMATSLQAQPNTFDLTQPQPTYTAATGYGIDRGTTYAPKAKQQAPFYFSVQLPDGNWRVTLTLGSKRRAAQTVVRAESRRLLLENTATRKGELKTFTFVVNKRTPVINDKEKVLIKDREKDYMNWDDRLTLEFNGPNPAVSSISIEPDTSATTLYLCGNSTVVDQNLEPWASWGQMIPRWFNDKVAVANYAESGLSATSFIAQKRLAKIESVIKPGDYIICEFGHNDQKEKAPGSGAYYNFAYALKKFIDMARQKQAHLIFVTPTQRRAFDETHTHILETHLNYPDAMREVARREGIPVVELHDMTRTFFETLGYENSKRALVHYPAGTFPGQDKELADNTHFNPYGAYEVAKMVVMGLKQLSCPIAVNLRNDWTDFSPSTPDSFESFQWYPAPLFETRKPDGN